MLRLKLYPGTAAAAIAPRRVQLGFFASHPEFLQRASRPRAAAMRLAVTVARVSVPLP